MTCPACFTDQTFPMTAVPPISVCPHCGRTVIVNGNEIRLAVAEDTRNLTLLQQKTLKQLRPKV